MSTQQTQVDDLTAIRGIGRSRQKWFDQVFAVRTYDQLALLPADTIEAALKAAGKLSSRTEIENWLAQARELAATRPAQPEESHVVAEASTNGGGAVSGQGASTAKMAPEGEAWTPVASFVIEFQRPANAPDSATRRTAVHYVEADRGAFWPGVAFDQVQAWLAAHVTVPEPPASKPFVEPTLPAGVPAEPSTLRATEVRVIQPPHYRSAIDVTQPSASLAIKNVSHDKPITIEVDMAVSGVAPVIKGALQYTARCQVHDLTRGQRPYWLNMEEVGPAPGDQTPGYRSQRAELRLEPGTYELSVLLSGRHVTGPYYLELPRLNVL